MTREEAKEYLDEIASDLGFIGMEEYTCKDGVKMHEAIKVLEQAPKIGHWKYDDVLGYEGHFGAYTCSCCNKAFLDDLCMNNGSYEINVGNEFKYCPFCGAKMSEIPTGSESEG